MKRSINSILVLALCFCVSAISADTNLRGRELQGKSKSMKKKSEKRGRELQGKSKSTKQKSETDVNCRASRWRRKARVRKKSANGSPTVRMKSARKITTRIPSFAIEMNALNAALGLPRASICVDFSSYETMVTKGPRKGSSAAPVVWGSRYLRYYTKENAHNILNSF